MLLNICCATCTLPIVEYLAEAKPVLYFYSPNIYPPEEYARRRDEARKIAVIYELDFWEGDYDHAAWLSYLEEKLMEPLENYPENGERCQACFQYRLKQTAEFAKENDFDEFGTTLSVSRFKDTDFINNYGKWLAGKYQLNYRTFPLDPEEAHCKGLQLSKKHNIYRQKYCGCEFSLPGRQAGLKKGS
jgi:hypothetical protein